MSILKQIKLLPARERVASSLRKAIILKEFESGHELMLDAVAKMEGDNRLSQAQGRQDPVEAQEIARVALAVATVG